jgi:APA family basic amino acid/polyamine antiporter
VVVLFYMLYYLGISGVLSNAQILEAGDGAPVKVISLIFGRIGGTVLTVFVIISCLGTLNGLIMGSVRGMYSIASRNMGPHPGFFKRISPRTNSTINSALIGLVFSLFWMVVWYGNFAGWWGSFMDISELPIAFLYIIYIAIYIWVMRTFTDLSFASRFIAPLLSGAGSLYIIFGAVQKAMFGWFFIITMLIIGVSLFFMKKRS